jgi:hypothetical protein
VTPFERGVALAAVDAIVLLPVVAPIALVALAPGLGDRVLPAIKRGVDRYGVRVGAFVFAAIGVWLIATGIERI